MRFASTTSRIAGGFAAAGFHQLVNIGLQLALVPILATKWGVQVYGIWLMLFTVPGFLALGDFGFANAAAIKIAMRLAHSEPTAAARIFYSAWAISLGASCSICFTAVAVVWWLPDALFGVPDGISPSALRQSFSLLVGYAWLSLQGAMFMGALRASGDFALSSLTSATIYLFEGVLAACAVLLGGSIVAAAAMYFVGRLLGFCLLVWISRRRAKWLQLPMGRPIRTEIHGLLKPAFASMALPFSMAGLLQGTALTIGAAAGSTEVAVFTTVRTLTRAGVQVASLFTQPVAPEFSASYARSQRDKLTRLYLYTLIASLTVLVPAYIVLCLVGPQIIEIWTRGAIHCDWTLIFLMATGMFFNGLWTPTSALLQAINRHVVYAYLFAALAALSLILSYFLARQWGAAGGAVSMMALDGLMLVLVQILARRFISSLPSAVEQLPWLMQKGRTFFAREWLQNLSRKLSKKG